MPDRLSAEAATIDAATRDAATDRIDAVLPQTQCRQCGFDGCRPYAAAIAEGNAAIDRCPPGGADGIVKLSRVTGLPVRPLDITRGIPKPLALAVVDESACIGCTLCIQACPVDAIVGGAKRMHVVVADLCTGCELCIPPCPVDCIDLVEASHAWDDVHASQARTRHRRRAERLARPTADYEPTGPLAPVAPVAPLAPVAPVAPVAPLALQKQAIVAAAVERARALAEARRSR